MNNTFTVREFLVDAIRTNGDTIINPQNNFLIMEDSIKKELDEEPSQELFNIATFGMFSDFKAALELAQRELLDLDVESIFTDEDGAVYVTVDIRNLPKNPETVRDVLEAFESDPYANEYAVLVLDKEKAIAYESSKSKEEAVENFKNAVQATEATPHRMLKVCDEDILQLKVVDWGESHLDRVILVYTAA